MQKKNATISHFFEQVSLFTNIKTNFALQVANQWEMKKAMEHIVTKWEGVLCG